MNKRFETGKILVHMARHGLPKTPRPDAKQKFWAKSYGEGKLNVNDVITITIHRTIDSPEFECASEGMMEAWRVTEVRKPPHEYYNETLTYFERL